MENRVNLVGMFFLTVTDGKAQWQGRVIAEVSAGYFLCQLYDWLVGAPSWSVVRCVADMGEWRFYVDDEDWRCAAGAF